MEENFSLNQLAERRSKDFPTPKERQNEISRIYEEVKIIFQKNGENGLEEGDVELVIKDPPRAEGFPIIMLMVAILKDILDGLQVTGLLYPLTIAFSIALWFVLFFWIHNRSRSWWQRKFILKWFLKRMGFVIVFESMPFLSLIPTSIILVLMVYYREKKMVRLFGLFLDELKKGRLLGK